MTDTEKIEYYEGYIDGYDKGERKPGRTLESWYSAGFTNGKQDRIMDVREKENLK